MLSPDDAAVARRDPAIPGLAVTLDRAELGRRLVRALPATAAVRVRLGYVRYKPGTSCVVGLRLNDGRRIITGYVKAHGHHDGDKARKLTDTADRPGPWGPGAVELGDGVVLVFGPNDRSLPGYARSGPDELGRLAHRVLGDVPPGPLSLCQLSYKPERRSVARLDGPHGPLAVLRCYADRRAFTRARDAAALLGGISRRHLIVPDVLGASVRHRILAVTWLPGEPAHGAPPERRTGQALAELHRTPVGPRSGPDGRPGRVPTVLDRAEERGHLEAAAVAVAGLAPALADRAEELCVRLTGRLSALPVGRTVIHGDFSPDQVVPGARRVGIIDLDAVRIGDPAADLGLHRATRTAAAVRRPGRAPLVPGPDADPLIAGYRSVATEHLADLGPRVDIYTAAWLLRLSVEPFRHRWDGWAAACSALLDHADAALRASEVSRARAAGVPDAAAGPMSS